MLESPGNIDMIKLRAILLLEANFNSMNKILFNGCILPSLENSQSILYEVIGGRRDQSLYYIALNKKLVSDISNQMKKPTIIMNVDATNYYDCIAHPIASLTYQYFRL